ncbi:MAG: DEAD/DEAH box helicase [Vicinamibacterales bacterium]
MSFSELGLLPALCTTLDRLQLRTPTPIQAQAIPLALAGADIVARAQTGTGKTAAFGLPLIQRLAVSPHGGGRRRPRALVLVPTRELAVQVQRSLASYAASTTLELTAIYGGASMSAQLRDLRRGVDVVVATPGRLIDHLERRSMDLSAVQVLALDEADRMLDMGFQPALRRIMPLLPASRQTLLFSATLSDAVVRLARDFTTNPTRVDVSDGQVVAATVSHHVHAVAPEQKRALLTHLLTGTGEQALVFCKTKHGSDRVGEHLERAGLAVAVIHGDKSQGQRTRALGAFKAGRVGVLVATDVAARGLDIAHLPLVVNFDLPLVPEDYVHRVGRTGRAGRDGRAVSIVSTGDARLLRDIERLLPVPLAHLAVEGFVSVPLANNASHRARPGRSAGSPHDRGAHRPRPARGARGTFRPGRRPAQAARPALD